MKQINRLIILMVIFFMTVITIQPSFAVDGTYYCWDDGWPPGFCAMEGYTLSVTRIAQEKYHWCWAACSLMILNAWGVYEFMEWWELEDIDQAMIARYALLGSEADVNSYLWNLSNNTCTFYDFRNPVCMVLSHFGSLNSSRINSELSDQQCLDEINEGRPFIMDWYYFDIQSYHALVAYGWLWDYMYEQKMFLLIHDPWPKGVGQSVMLTYEYSVLGNNHSWERTLYEIE